MSIITVTGHKGGIGKTTISILIACKALAEGKKVAMLDLDPQQSLTEWWQERPENDPLQVISVDRSEQIQQAITLLQKSADLLIIDTPPAHKLTISEAVQCADLVVIPCSPSPMDIKGVGETISLIEHYKKPFFFVLNRANMRANLSNQTLVLLAQHGKVCPSPLGMRIDYAQGVLSGHSPLDLNNKELQKEVSGMYEYLITQLGKL